VALSLVLRSQCNQAAGSVQPAIAPMKRSPAGLRTSRALPPRHSDRRRDAEGGSASRQISPSMQRPVARQIGLRSPSRSLAALTRAANSLRSMDLGMATTTDEQQGREGLVPCPVERRYGQGPEAASGTLRDGRMGKAPARRQLPARCRSGRRSRRRVAAWQTPRAAGHACSLNPLGNRQSQRSDGTLDATHGALARACDRSP
jgi:hypothetical protein